VIVTDGDFALLSYALTPLMQHGSDGSYVSHKSFYHSPHDLLVTVVEHLLEQFRYLVLTRRLHQIEHEST
jgi:hypothetical protein